MQAQLNKKHMTAAAERQGNHQASDEGQPAAQQGECSKQQQHDKGQQDGGMTEQHDGSQCAQAQEAWVEAARRGDGGTAVLR